MHSRVIFAQFTPSILGLMNIRHKHRIAAIEKTQFPVGNTVNNQIE